MKGTHFWLGDENSFSAMLDIEQRIQSTPMADLQEMSIKIMAQSMEAAESEDFGEYGYMVSRFDNLALVNISGPLVTRNSPFNSLFGRVSYDEIRNAVFTAMEAPGIDGIVLNMDTPGGSASGISELSDFLTDVDKSVKPIYTYTGTMMASGGYWLGSIGREIFASKLATVGSIGVVTVHASIEKMLKDNGVEVNVLRAGEFKALGSPFEKLDEKARAQIESQMNTIYGVFLSTVADQRGTSVPVLKEKAAEGRVFVGADAVSVGLVDHITSFDSAMAQISGKLKKSNSRREPFVQSQTTIGDTAMGKKRVLTETAIAAIASGASEEEVRQQAGMTEEVEEEGGEGAVTAGADPEAGSDEGAGSAGGEAAAGEEGAEAPQVQSGNAAEQSLVDRMFNRVSELTVEVAELKVKLKQAEQERDSSKSSETGLMRIAITAINRMQIGLGSVPIKLDSADAATVIDQYTRTYNQFNQRYPSGGRAEVPSDEDTVSSAAGEGEESNNTVNAAVHRLTTARVQRK